MKFTAGIIAALASCTTAAAATGQAFILPRDESVSTASLGRSLARLVFLQRLANPGEGPTIKDIPADVSADDAIATLNKFASSQDALFTPEPASPTKRLFVMIEAMTAQQIQKAGKALGQDAAFSIEDLPSSAANRDLLEIDAYNAGATTQHSCSLGEIVQMKDTKCWGASSTAARYNVAQNPESMTDILEALPKLAKAGNIEATIVLLPKTNNDAKQSWSDKPQELRRRQAEQVISSNHRTTPVSVTYPAATHTTVYAPKKPIPACFSSKESCMNATADCSSHGECVNKYGAIPENPKEGDVCFVCHCQATKTANESVTHWGGATCAKQDVSVPFWLFFGFTIVIVGVVWMAIGLLYSVGEEKLPGVIGAGVSRSK